MKKLFILSGLATTLFASSCKKDEQDLLVGTWTAQYGAEDDNNNGVMDASEKIVSTDHKNTLTLNADGTGVIVYQYTASDPVQTTNINYSLTEDGKKLTMSTSSGSEVYNIETLTKTELMFSYQPAGDKKGWISYSK